jgi:hypothetical protein
MEQSEIKYCHSCAKPIKGRTDKKFCDDYCRNTYNNCLNGADNNYIRNINNALRRNRRILEELIRGSTNSGKSMREDLFNRGFQFQYFTHVKTNKQGKTAYFCYDFGYQLLTHESLKIIQTKQLH